MAKLFQKGVRYLRCYNDLTFGRRPQTPEAAVDFCVDRPILMTQVRSEILALGKLLQDAAPKRSLEIGTAYGGTLFFLCTLSPPDALMISVDLRAAVRRRLSAPQDSPVPQIPHQAPETSSDSGGFACAGNQGSRAAHSPRRAARYLFIDGDHTYAGVKCDFDMYAPLVRSKGMIAFHDIAVHKTDPECQVAKFWDELKQRYEFREFIERPDQGWAGIGVVFKP